MAERFSQRPPEAAARGWVGAAAVIAAVGAIGAITGFFQISAVTAVAERIRLGIAPAGVAEIWWWGAVPLATAVTCLLVAYGLVRQRAWAWYAAVAIGSITALGAVVLLVSGVRASGEGFAAIGKFYLLVFGAALAVGTVFTVRSLRRHGPDRGLRVAAPRTGLVMAPVIAALVAGFAANAFEGVQAASNAADEEAMSARLSGLSIDLNLVSAETRLAKVEANIGSGDLVDVEVVERLSLELVMESTADVELAEVRACLRTALPTRDPAIGSLELLRPFASTDQATELCWDHLDLEAALDQVLGQGSDGVLHVVAGDRRSVSVTLERDEASCDYPAGPWTLEVFVLPLGSNPEHDPFFGITPQVDGMPEVAFEVPAGGATGSIGESARYCAALE